MAAKPKCTIPKTKVIKILQLLKFLANLNKKDQETSLKFLNDEGLEYISETIFNILYNSDCTSSLTKDRRKKLIKTLKPKDKIFQQISNKQRPILSRRKKILQSGSGISLLLSAAIPFLVSLLLPRK